MIAGVATLISRMLFMESQASDSEFDMVFLFSLIVWSASLAALYVFYAIIFYLVIGKHRNKV